MYKGSRSRFFPILVVIIIAAIVIFGIVSVVRSSLGNDSSKKKETPTVSLTSQLLNTDDGRSVSMEVRGPIVGDEAFRSYQMTISPMSRSITTWSGYDHSNIIDSETLTNDTKSYDEFVHALDYAGYIKTDKVDIHDTSGLCANGRVYTFTIAAGADSLDDRWTTNCGIKGNFRGNGTAIRQLFLKQMPNATEYVSKINL